ncbi:MAG: ABC transporter permease [Coriobacteriia bacterium]|nr:ABC transporter permease [Coriobacteriia bacterium]
MLNALFLNEIRRIRFGLLIWSLIVALIVGLGIMEYPMLKDYLGTMVNALSMIPKMGQLVFGVYDVDLFEPIGYYVVMYYWTCLVVFTHAVYTGASIVSKESRDKTAEFLFTKPCKRNTIIWAKICAALVNITVVGLVALLVSLVSMIVITSDPTTYLQVLVSGLGMYLTQCVLAALGLLISALLKTYRSTVMVAVAVLLASYCLMFFVQYTQMPQFNFISPLAFFQVSDVVANGLSIPYVLLSAAVIAVCLFLTQKFFAKKTMVV